jgi:HAMP domain-containing protein
MARASKQTGAEAPAQNLTNQQVLSALRALKRGDFDVRLPEDFSGIQGQICQVFNEVSATAQGMTGDVAALRHKVGSEGRTTLRLASKGLKGGWGSISEGVNEMLDDLTMHAAGIARVVTAVGRGDLSQRIDLQGEREPLQGDFLKDAKAVNGMVDQLEVFGSEVTRVARQVGIEGKLGAQADIPGVSGSWRELTDSVNQMASNLTSQVREIARVTTAVAQGDLTQTVDIEARGEILELKKTINTMVDQLGSFADEVTRVAREVGTEGQLGGQAQVKGISGTWKELTQNVNSMAANLTNQVRNIAEVATAIADGDLSKQITIDARGEIL